METLAIRGLEQQDKAMAGQVACEVGCHGVAREVAQEVGSEVASTVHPHSERGDQYLYWGMRHQRLQLLLCQ